MTSIPVSTTKTPSVLGTSDQGPVVGLKIQLASDSSGDYVPVVALDSDLGISIGSVSQQGTWTVTANAGTNLNTSTLARETGGNLATLAGAVSAGKVQTTVATALPAGSAIIGKVGIDQTTPGTTNKVSIGTDGTVALATGAATIGAVNQGTSPWVVQQSDNRAVDQTINSASLNAAVTVTLNGGEGEVGFTITGLTAAGATLTFEGSNNIGAASPQWGGIQALSGSAISSTATADGSYRVEAGGRTAVRVRVSSTGTGTITISYSGSSASSLVSLAQSLPAGSNGIGNVGGKTVSVTVTPTVTASNAYGTNYVVGGLLTFANAFTSTGSGILQSVVVTCKKVETSGFTLFVFNGNPSNTTWTDAAVAAINANDVSLVREPVSLTANSQLGIHTVAYATGLGQAMAPGSTTLYGVLIANAALTNQFGSTTDITVTVKVLQDC